MASSSPAFDAARFGGRGADPAAIFGVLDSTGAGSIGRFLSSPFWFALAWVYEETGSSTDDGDRHR